MDTIRRELAHAVRRLVRSPAFTLTSVTTLALAIGANVAIFTLVHRVVLNPLPYPDADRLIDLDHAAPGLNARSGVALSAGLYHHYREHARTLESIALYRSTEATLTGNGEPDRIRVVRTTPSLAAVLRVAPAAGRWFREEEAAPGAEPVAIVSHGLWMRRYGGDRGILGRAIQIEGTPVAVIGIMPAAFAFPDPQVQVWLPRQDARAMVFDDFSDFGIARLHDGVALDAARAELSRLIAQLPAAYPDRPAVSGLVDRAKLMSVARTLKDARVGRITRVLWVLLASVAFVLLIACANVANLFLVRSEVRQSEVAVRRALGAGRAAVAGYFAAESAIVTLAGGALGLTVAWVAVRLLVDLGPATLPRLDEVAIDGVAVTYALLLTSLATITSGAIPLWHGTSVAGSLGTQGRGHTASRSRHLVRQVLMGVQVALALVLLVASSLMVRSFQNLRAIDPGFEPASALTFRFGLPDRAFRDRAAVVAAHQTILDRLAALPGVTGVSAATRIPLADLGRGFSSLMRVEGRPAPPPGSSPPIVTFRAVAGGYFETMGTRVVRGRGIERGDVERRELVAVVNQALVDAFFPNQDPIGARVARGTAIVNSSWLTIVGVVPNTPIGSLTEAASTGAVSELSMPISISGPSETPGLSANGPPVASMSYVVRSATPPEGLLASVRRVVDTVDANLALAQVRTLEDLLEAASAQMAFTMRLLAIAAGGALLLGLIGIYGAVSYIVSQRTREIGVRLALGAEPRAVTALIVRQGAVVALGGLVAGLGAAIAGSRAIEALLYDISPRDPVVFATSMLGLFAVSLCACWLPARRAARVRPVDALRAE